MKKFYVFMTAVVFSFSFSSLTRAQTPAADDTNIQSNYNQTVLVKDSYKHSENDAFSGYSASPAAVNLDDDDYRPDQRSFMIGEKIIFPNLQEGNKVTIFTMRNKQVKSITSAPFEWDGRNSSGGFVESGTYLYQIEVEGRVISGTLAFIR